MDYKEVPNTNIVPTPPETPPKPPAIQLSIVSKDFWTRLDNNSKYIESFNRGNMLGKFNKSNNIKDFFDKLSYGLKEIIVYELNKKNVTAEKIKNDLTILDCCLKNISTNIQSQNADINVKEILANLQGFITGSIENSIKEE